MSTFHDAAMKAQTAGNEVECEERLGHAEQLMDQLTAYVQKVIKVGPMPLKAE